MPQANPNPIKATVLLPAAWIRAYSAVCAVDRRASVVVWCAAFECQSRRRGSNDRGTLPVSAG